MGVSRRRTAVSRQRSRGADGGVAGSPRPGRVRVAARPSPAPVAVALLVALTLLALWWLGAAPRAGAADILGPNVAIPFPLFPIDNPWNARVDALPLDPHSAAYLEEHRSEHRSARRLRHRVWDGAPNGIPYVCVSGTQKKVPVSFDYADESDPGPYPIPSDAPIEGGSSSDGDRHVLVLDVDHQVLYELYAAYPSVRRQLAGGLRSGLQPGQQRPAAGRLDVGRRRRPAHPARSGALRRGGHRRGHRSRPALHGGAHAEGLHLPGDPLREQLDRPRPAAHGPARAPARPTSTSRAYSPEVQVILQALKTYGMMVADNGSNWYVSGAPDPRWSDDDLHELSQVKGSDFEVVDSRYLQPGAIVVERRRRRGAARGPEPHPWRVVRRRGLGRDAVERHGRLRLRPGRAAAGPGRRPLVQPRATGTQSPAPTWRR